MEHLSLNDIIEIYLGYSVFEGMDIQVSKEFAYQEIQKRACEYRAVNKISDLVSKLKNLNNRFIMVNKNKFITIIDNACGCDAFDIFRHFNLLCFNHFRPDLLDVFSEINDITNKLDILWGSDPEHLRHSSKFRDTRALSESQEYYVFYDFGNGFLTKSNLWRTNISCTLRFENMILVSNQCKKSNISFLPISTSLWEINRLYILNFLLYFNSGPLIKSFLWVLFIKENQDAGGVDKILNEIRLFSNKLFNNSGFYLNLLPYSILERKENGTIDYGLFFEDFEKFINKYIE